MQPVSQDDIDRAAQLIRRGNIVAFPTETVYGLGANALNARAVERIFEAKGRPLTSPLIVHVASISVARQLTAEWPPEAEALALRFWPGPLTLVLPKHHAVPDLVTAGLDSVGIRMPAHPVAQALLAACGVPVAAPSANRFTGLSPTRAEHVRDSLGGRVDFILDGGPAEIGIESTVVSLCRTPAAILRLGMISRSAIEGVIGAVVLATSAPGEGSHVAPGMHERHYSPRTPLVIAQRPGLAIVGRGPGSGRMCPMPADPEAYAARLYAVLHELDREGWESIEVEAPPDSPEWAAIHDRLRRAATSGK